MKLCSFSIIALFANVVAQPPGQGTSCPDGGGFQGLEQYKGSGATATPLRGAIACVDAPINVGDQVASLIFGPMEAGFSSTQLQNFFGCKAGVTVLGGLDTLTAELIVEHECELEPGSANVLDLCGGHATPYHYHERMGCLYTSDTATGHSTRIGTALDGNGLYGKYVDGGKVPTDLDACGGRTGVTPDSNGEEVYYYVVQDQPPFTVGCFGPVNSLEECKALYATCGDDATEITTAAGSQLYDLDCPCYENGINVVRDSQISIARSEKMVSVSVAVIVGLVYTNISC